MKKKLAIISSVFFLTFAFASNAMSQWIQTNGPGGGNVACFAVSGNNVFAGTGGYDNQRRGEVFLSTNNGLSWTSVSSGLPSSGIKSLVVNGSNIFAAVSGSGVFRSSDNGANWVAVNSGLTDILVQTLIVKGTNLFVGTYNGIFKSSDNGDHWSELIGVSQGLSSVECFGVSGSNIVASGFGDKYAGIFLSKDDGLTWTMIDTIYPGLTGNSVTAFASIGNILIAGEYYGILLSTDNGSTWQTVNSTDYINTFVVYLSSDNGVNWIQLTSFKNIGFLTLAHSGSTLFAGTDSGVFLTTNNGVSWTQANTGLNDNNVFVLQVMGADIYAGTNTGVWRRPLSDFGISDIKNLPQPDLSISLSPNPTTGLITIHNAPANMLHVTITNVLGETVSEAASSGAADFKLDLSKHAPGIYFVRLGGESVKVIKN
jgi:photosystem II stability/assembly factor-like uncharacterized protein